VLRHPNYQKNVFINCPYDKDYKEHFLACIFTIKSCDLIPVCARERDNAGQGRLDKIIDLIRDSRYSIHDLSRTGIDKTTKLARFNMPFELGIVYGAIQFNIKHKDKSILVFEAGKRDVLKLLSDLRSIDPKCHNNNVNELITGVRSWLQTEIPVKKMPGDLFIYGDFKLFINAYPTLVSAMGLTESSITHAEQVDMIESWINKTKAVNP
jgi:hypothetical protein